MKESLDVRRQRLEKLLADPALLKRAMWVFVLFILTVTLFGILTGSIVTAIFFPNANF
ncbi:MAG: hypothetical protein ACKO96_47370 [Flammeovirgaceae bacterium]